MESRMQLNDILPERSYRTRSGAVCKVMAMKDDEDKTVSFVRYDEHQKAGDTDEMPGVLFAANAVEEAELVDPQGKPMDEDAPATPV
jgi:hypothetical protein